MSQPAAAPSISAEPDAPLGEFSLSEARTIVGDFFRPNPWIFWTDFLLSWSVGVAAFTMVEMPELFVADARWHWPARVVGFFVSSLLYYRCSLFIHELVHIRSGEFTAFRFVWNALCGIPFLIPTFVYYTHLDHHRRKHFGTKADGEYIPLARLPIWQLWFYLSQVLVIPVLALLRFGLLTPLSWVSRPVRNWVHRHASSMIMDPMYIRPLPTKRVLRIIRLQEVLCFLFIVFVGLRIFYPMGFLPGEISLSFLLHVYLTGVFVLIVNALRTLGAHRWTSDGHEGTFVEQLLDSVNFPNSPILGPLWAPVGLRYHALHHIFPTMPYHALAVAHRRLMRDLPADSPYRQCNANSLLGVLGLLWRRARANH